MTPNGDISIGNDTKETLWLTDLKQGKEQALEAIFECYYRYLVVTAFQLLHDDARAKDIVQDVFFSLWEKRMNLNIQGNLKSYLRRSVVNRSIDEIRRNKRMVWQETTEIFPPVATANTVEQQLAASELKIIINRAIESLPERCRQVFALSRFEDLPNKEIASQLGISIKTVENQMTKALKWIRQAVDQHYVFWWWLVLLLLWR